MLPNKKNLWSTPTAFDAHNIKGERKKSTGGQIEPLQQQVRMWPTPTVDNNEHKNMKVDEKGRRIATKEGGTTHSLNLADTVRMWPTPTSVDYMTEQSSRVEINNDGGFTLRKKNKPHMKYGAKLTDAVSYVEKQEMWPTPQAADNRDRGNMSDPSVQRRIKIGKQVMLSQKVKKTKGTGSLNPDWVEWLMGYGQGYTDPDNKDKFTLDSHQGFPNEPEIARVTTENQYRKDRLKALGNSIVPQIAYHIGLAILEQEKT